MFVTIKERLRQLEETRKKVEDGSIVFDPNQVNFGFRRMDQLLDVSEDAIKGYPCVAYNRISDSVKFGIKLIPLENRYPKETHPCHLEARVLREATELVRKSESPHIAYYFTSFPVRNKNKAVVRFPLKALHKEVYKESDVLVAEYVPGGCVDEWVDEQPNITEKQWKYVIFSVAWTLYVLQDKLRLHHNDFHCGNVLIDTSIDPCDKSYYQYVLEKLDGESMVFNVQSCGVLVKLWDPEFSASYDKDRTFKNDFYEDDEEDIPHTFNPHYDLHCFLMSLLSLPIPTRLMEYIYSIYPREVIPPESEMSRNDTLGSRTGSSVRSDDHYYDEYDDESSVGHAYDSMKQDEGKKSVQECVESQEGYDSYANSDTDERYNRQLPSDGNAYAQRTLPTMNGGASRYDSQRQNPQQNWDELQQSLYYERHYRTDESSSVASQNSGTGESQNTQDDASSSYYTDSSRTSRIRTEYTLGDRLLNGAEKVFNLPTPYDIITSDYFSEYRKPIPAGLRKDGTKRVPSCVFTYAQRDHSEEEAAIAAAEAVQAAELDHRREQESDGGDLISFSQDASEYTRDDVDVDDADYSDLAVGAFELEEESDDDISVNMKVALPLVDEEAIPVSKEVTSNVERPVANPKRKLRRPPTPIPKPRKKQNR